MNLIWLFFLICLIHHCFSFQNFYDNDFDDELLRVLNRKLHSIASNSDEDYEDDDPTDDVNVELWNKLNDIDIKNMPLIHDYSSEKEAWNWYNWHTRIELRYHQIAEHLDFIYKTNITKENQKAISTQSVIASSFPKVSYPFAKKFNESLISSQDKELKSIFNSLSRSPIKSDQEYIKKTVKLSSKLEDIYSRTEVCEENNSKQCYPLTPSLERLMQVERNYDRLLWAWKGWHNQCGNQIRAPYLTYIDLLNKNTQKNGFRSLAEKWVEEYDMGNETEFERIFEDILEKMMPLYRQLHAFVRGRLCEIYPNRFDCNGPIPAHILGNMWAQQWNDRFDDFLPYPQKSLINITKVLHEKKYTIHQMYKTAEQFFTSIGLYSMTNKFWSRSMFIKPNDREVVCQPSAFNMAYHDDYRAKICTEINEDYYYTVHHEMGHVEYYMSYEHQQPFRYRQGANSGFHEAIGDTIGLYAMSPTHLIKLGFIEPDEVNSHYEINFLMRMALQKVAFLPYGYTFDKYRYALFRNEFDPQTELNSKWWQMRIQYGGIKPPIPRHDPENFDPGAKYHTISNTPYARYFIAHILQFQFYRTLCRLQGDTERLHMCDIYGNKYVGKRFRNMLALGSSKSWSKVLKSLTGEDRLEPQAMLDYFQPLYKWLKLENIARGYPVGW